MSRKVPNFPELVETLKSRTDILDAAQEQDITNKATNDSVSFETWREIFYRASFFVLPFTLIPLAILFPNPFTIVPAAFGALASLIYMGVESENRYGPYPDLCQALARTVQRFFVNGKLADERKRLMLEIGNDNLEFIHFCYGFWNAGDSDSRYAELRKAEERGKSLEKNIEQAEKGIPPRNSKGYDPAAKAKEIAALKQLLSGVNGASERIRNKLAAEDAEVDNLISTYATDYVTKEERPIAASDEDGSVKVAEVEMALASDGGLANFTPTDAGGDALKDDRIRDEKKPVRS